MIVGVDLGIGTYSPSETVVVIYDSVDGSTQQYALRVDQIVIATGGFHTPSSYDPVLREIIATIPRPEPMLARPEPEPEPAQSFPAPEGVHAPAGAEFRPSGQIWGHSWPFIRGPPPGGAGAAGNRAGLPPKVPYD